jgi:RNA polymerase primary sigma factor
LSDKARTIRMPVHVVEKLNKIVGSERRLSAEFRREPTPAEIAIEVGLPVEEVEQILRSAQTPVSLEAPVGDEEESEFGYFPTDEKMPLPEDATEMVLRTAALTRCLDSLGGRQRRVLDLRYGLDGERPRTLEEIGVIFNVTRERVRQIEKQSLKKLGTLAEAQHVREVASDARNV